MFRNQNKNKGFTLVELMVTTGMMMLLASVIIANFGGLGKKRNLTIARNNLVSDIRKNQSLALSSKDISPGVIAGYYGIQFTMSTPDQYAMVADDNSGARQPGQPIVKLPSKVQISSIQVIKPDGTVLNPTTVDLLFRTAYGRGFLSYSGNGTQAFKESDDQLKITFTSAVDNVTSVVVDVNGITGNVNPGAVYP